MAKMKQTKKYYFSVEGETEQWYLLWLRDQINACDDAKYKVAIEPKVEKSPLKYIKKADHYRQDGSIPFVGL